ncbi:MAG: DUF819 family protein [Planctomycetota bacterium]
MPTRLRAFFALALSALLFAACSKPHELEFSTPNPAIGDEIEVTLKTEYPNGSLVHFYSGIKDGEKTVTPILAHQVSIPLGGAEELGTATVEGGLAKLKTSVPFESRFSGRKFEIVAAVELGEAIELVDSRTERSVKSALSVGPRQPFLGEQLELKLQSARRSTDAVAYVFRGDLSKDEEPQSNFTIGDRVLSVPLKNAALVAALPFASGSANKTLAISDTDYPTDSRVPLAMVVVEDGVATLTHQTQSKPISDVLITNQMGVLAVLLLILAALFAMSNSPTLGRIFKILPLLVFCYFVPTAFSNLGVIPIESSLYGFIKTWLLPASLLLLTMSVDIPAILRLGKQALSLFLLATLTIVIGGPIAYAILYKLVPEELGSEAWRGLAALSGSWIGGTANMVAIGQSVGVEDSTFQKMIVVDVAVANIWMAVLLFFAGREKAMDEKIGADRSAIDACKKEVEAFEAEVQRPTNLPDLLLIVTIAIGGTVLAATLAGILPTIGSIVSKFTWVVILVTTFGVALSFTKLRRLEGSGASKVGSVFLFLLVASIGAHAEFSKIVDAPALVAIGALWMAFHAGLLLFFRWLLKAPIFFLAVGSKANIGGAASAPIVAAAFHPALAPVGILLAVAGYVLGTYAGLLCAFLLELVHKAMS